MRSPEQIKREVEAARAALAQLEAELETAPPRLITLDSAFGEGRVTFAADNPDEPRICVNRGLAGFLGNRVKAADVPRLRAWLDHYYPQES